MFFLRRVISKLKYGLLALLLVPFFAGFVNAADDLLRESMKYAVSEGLTIDVGESVNTVGKNVIEGKSTVSVDSEGIHRTKNGPSIIVKITRVLLALVIALSISMILYNGLSYIIQTGQGKEGKNLVKNVVYIVIGILISLLSVTIITLLQSVSTTLDEETAEDKNQGIDNNLTQDGADGGSTWGEIFSFFGGD